jgi:hypothetical protein
LELHTPPLPPPLPSNLDNVHLSFPLFIATGQPIN